MKRKVIKLSIVLICILLNFSCEQVPEEVDNPVYKVITIRTTDAEISSSYPASIQGRQDIDIYPQVSGTISNVCVKEGQSVKKENHYLSLIKFRLKRHYKWLKPM